MVLGEGIFQFAFRDLLAGQPDAGRIEGLSFGFAKVVIEDRFDLVERSRAVGQSVKSAKNHLQYKK